MISKNLKSFLTGQSLVTLCYYLVFTGILFSVLFFIYQPEFINFKLQPFFIFDSSFFSYYQNQHFGLLKIISQYFLQFTAFPLAGALILTTLFLTLAIQIYLILDLKRFYFLGGIEFIPGFILLATLKNYTLGIEPLIVLLLVTSILLISRLIPKAYFIFRLLFLVLAVCLTFFGFDVLSAMTLAILALLHELIYTRSKWKFVYPLVFGAVILLLIHYTLGFAMLKPLLQDISAENKWAIMPGYSRIVVISSGIFLLVYLMSLFPVLLKPIAALPKPLITLIPVVVLLTAGTIFNKELFLNPKKYNTAIEYYANQKDWKEVLRYRNSVDKDDRISLFELNRALYHLGDFSEKFFSNPQNWGVHTLFLTIEFNRECTLNSSDLYFDMGFIKGAQYWALEAQTHQPYSPRVLKRIVICSLLTRDIPVAEKYLNILSKSPVYAPWANEIRKEIEKDQVSQLKAELFGNRDIDFDILYINNKNPHYDVLQILKKDPENKMAFEYLMAYYLLSNELGNFHHFLKAYNPYPDKKLPGMYQEALLIFMMSMNISTADLGFSIDEGVKEKLLAFNKVLIEYKMDEKKARKDLYRLFGDTYWYYLRYLSPRATGSTIKRKSL